MKYWVFLLKILIVAPALSKEKPDWMRKVKAGEKKDIIGDYTISKLEGIKDLLNTSLNTKGKVVIKFLPFRNKSLLFNLMFSSNGMQDKFSSITQIITNTEMENSLNSINKQDNNTEDDVNNNEVVNKKYLFENLSHLAVLKDFEFFFTTNIVKLKMNNLNIQNDKENINSLKVFFDLIYENNNIKVEITAKIKDKRKSKLDHFLLSCPIIVISFLHLLATSFLIFLHYKKKIELKHISFFFIHIDSIWNAMHCIVLSNISSQVEFDSHSFCFPAFIYCFIFGFCETYLMYLIYKGKDFTCFDIVKLIFFEFLVVSLTFFYASFYSICRGILFLVFPFTFIPQIIHFHIRKIRKSTFPFIISISFFLNKVYFPLACSINGDTFFNFNKNIKAGIIGLIIHIIQLAIFYLQNQYGYDFYLPIRKKNTIYKYLISFNDILKDKIYCNCLLKEKCPICISELMTMEDLNKGEYTKLEMISFSQNKEKPTKIDDSVYSTNEIEKELENLEKLRRWNCISAYKRINKNKSIVITPCKHLFHPSCIENWWKLKLECPFCRASLPPLEEID